MQEQYTPEESWFIMKIINHRRPRWAQSAITEQLKIAMLSGATLGQVTAAAERAAHNKKATAPTSIMWPEHWEEPKNQNAGNIAGPRLCVECTSKRPVHEMTRTQHGYICNNHQETA